MRWFIVMLLVGCGPASVLDDGTASQEAPLTYCPAGAAVGTVVMTPGFCTLKACSNGCCNRCSWSATFNGVPANHAQVEALGVEGSPTTCALATWQQFFATHAVNLELGCMAQPAN